MCTKNNVQRDKTKNKRSMKEKKRLRIIMMKVKINKKWKKKGGAWRKTKMGGKKAHTNLWATPKNNNEEPNLKEGKNKKNRDEDSWETICRGRNKLIIIITETQCSSVR